MVHPPDRVVAAIAHQQAPVCLQCDACWFVEARGRTLPVGKPCLPAPGQRADGASGRHHADGVVVRHQEVAVGCQYDVTGLVEARDLALPVGVPLLPVLTAAQALDTVRMAWLS
jgi:hypothetical protein